MLKNRYSGSKTLNYVIYSKPKSIKLNKSSVALCVGQTSTLEAKVIPSTAKQQVSYSSSNKKVATVSSNGKITAKTQGTAVITVKTGNKIVSKCAVKVYKVKLNYSSKNVKKIGIYTTYRDRYGDLVYCNKKGISSCILKVDSGLKSKETETFYWYPVMYNSNISRIDITKIIVTYSDGSKKTYSRNVFWYDSKYCG